MSRWLTPGEGAEEGRGLTASMIASGRFRRHDRPLRPAALLRRKLPTESSAVNRAFGLHKSTTEMLWMTSSWARCVVDATLCRCHARILKKRR